MTVVTEKNRKPDFKETRKLGWNPNMVNNWIVLDLTKLSINSIELTSILINKGCKISFKSCAIPLYNHS